MTYPLQIAADYIRTGKVPRGFFAFIRQVRRIFTFTQERANRLIRYIEITRAYKAGKPVREIEAKYGCSRQTVLRYARLAGLPKRPKGDVDRKAAIIAMYQQQKPIAEIAARLGVSQALVSKTATEAGINRRNFKPRNGRR